jgi:glycine cleavage system H lipoate-binding protein
VCTAKIYVDEESQLWNKTEITINVQSGKVVLPLYQNCQVTYGDAVKVSLPSKAKQVDTKTGSAEFSKAVASVR